MPCLLVHWLWCFENRYVFTEVFHGFNHEIRICTLVGGCKNWVLVMFSWSATQFTKAYRMRWFKRNANACKFSSSLLKECNFCRQEVLFLASAATLSKGYFHPLKVTLIAVEDKFLQESIMSLENIFFPLQGIFCIFFTKGDSFCHILFVFNTPNPLCWRGEGRQKH